MIAAVLLAEPGPACEAGCDRQRWDGSRAPAALVVAIGARRLHLCEDCGRALHGFTGVALAAGGLLAGPPEIQRRRRAGPGEPR